MGPKPQFLNASWFKGRWYLVGGLVIIIAVLVLGQKGFWNLVFRRQGIRQLRQQIVQLQQEEQDLRYQLKLASNDSAYLEHLARKELKLIRPGEVEYRFVEKKKR